MKINIKIYIFGICYLMVVSSAKRTIMLYLGIIVGKSFIYSRKCRGPRNEPWGTPFSINSDFEEMLMLLLLLLLSITL
jgi:hypothetical protein